MAAHFLRNERSEHTLQTTDLVHEAYLRLVNVHEVDWQHRAHFFAVAASVMRRTLVDRARRQSAAKRGARPALVDVDLSVDLLSVRAREVVALDDALNTLAGADPAERRSSSSASSAASAWKRPRKCSKCRRKR